MIDLIQKIFIADYKIKIAKNLLSLLMVIVMLTSCGGITNILSSGKFSEKENYKINNYVGCCGCQAKYFLINSGKRKMEQVIYSYNCYKIGSPTKFIFQRNKSGKIISCEKYVATTLNDFTLKLTEQEKELFAIVDTSITMTPNYSIIKLYEIKGFRKPTEDEITHSFPLIRKGYKLTVR